VALLEASISLCHLYLSRSQGSSDNVISSIDLGSNGVRSFVRNSHTS
jgi:hypothetical protein